MNYTKRRWCKKSCLLFCMIFAVLLTSCGEPSSELDEDGSLTSITQSIEVSSVITISESEESSETTLIETTVEDTFVFPETEIREETSVSSESTPVTTFETIGSTNSTSVQVTTTTTTMHMVTTEIAPYIPDSSRYIGIAVGIAGEYGCEVYVGADWSSYRNPILLDASLSDSVFEQYVREVMQELIAHGNGYRNSFQVWVSDERTSGNQTHGPGFYLYIG